MRTGLVALGAVFLVVAGAVVFTVWSAPTGSTVQSSRLFGLELSGHGNTTAFVWGLNGTSSGFTLGWHSDHALAATLATSSGCAGTPVTCQLGVVLERWTGNLSGSWTSSGLPAFPLLLQFQNSGPVPSVIQVGMSASGSTPPMYSTTAYIVFLVAGTALGAIGALTLFLGLFLH
ncbi:MAG: hypothetical protein ACHQ16_07030, partial [Candidatus Lutacidiplasmatales archaeon]